MNLEYYCKLFTNLSVKKEGKRKMPNKAIMLLGVMDLIRLNYYRNNRIPIDSIIVDAFNYNWNLYINATPPVPWTPFWHLRSEPFWSFVPINNTVTINSLVPPGGTASANTMRKNIAYAIIDNELFELLQNSESRSTLYFVLFDNYIKTDINFYTYI